MPLWRNSLSGVCTENQFEKCLIEGIPITEEVPITIYSTAGSRTSADQGTLSNCVEGVFPGAFQGGEGLAQGCVHVHGFMSRRTGSRTCLVPIKEGNIAL